MLPDSTVSVRYQPVRGTTPITSRIPTETTPCFLMLTVSPLPGKPAAPGGKPVAATPAAGKPGAAPGAAAPAAAKPPAKEIR